MPTPRRSPVTQASRIIGKFGGARRLCAILKHLGPEHELSPSSIYRWDYPKSKGGTGGVIPTAAMKSVILAARLEGIFLTPEDFYPGVVLK